jgi:hypothetical protein
MRCHYRCMNKKPAKENGVTMRTGNKGLTVALNFFSIEKDLDWFNSQAARLWFRGQVTHVDTKEVAKFNDAGQLITILGRWNSARYKELKAAKKK